MTSHESSVNFRNLIRDLTDMYPFDVEEVIITELIANSLDAHSTKISIEYDPKDKKLVVIDNGDGMTADQFKKYHDLAAGLKSRGSGIGFAGVGAKISFNIADRVITETISKNFTGGSNWQLIKQSDGDERLIWDDFSPSHIKNHGTRIQVDFSQEAKIQLSSTEDLIFILRKHYLPLFDKNFLQLYKELKRYNKITFYVNGQEINSGDLTKDFDLEKTKEVTLERSKKFIGFGIIGLSKREYPLGEEICGILISVCGKVVKSELFNQFPGRDGPKIFGIVEVPGLINFLNTSKLDFIHSKGNHREFESFYGPIREAFKQWLAEAGIQTQELDVSEETKKIERELKKILDEVPELVDFFGSLSRKNLPRPDENGEINGTETEGIQTSFPDGDGKKGKTGGISDIGPDPGTTNVENEKGEKATPISRSARRGPKIAFSISPDKLELAWVEGNTIYINTGHPIIVKMKGDFKEKRILYFVAIGCALQRFLTSEEKPADLLLIDRILSAWGKK